MTKKIILSNHAITRMFQRGLSEKEITETLNNPDYSIASYEGRKISTKRIGLKTVRIVYKEEPNATVVVTVY